MPKQSSPVWHMRRALRLAKKGRGAVSPNPMVGAVITKKINGKEVRIGEGWHAEFGKDHAEIAALKNCNEDKESSSVKTPAGGTMYVTLEPCCHIGKTGACTKAIIKSGIKKVFIACLDPSEKVAGKGAKELKAAGIEVEIGLLEDAAKELNKHFFTFHQKKRPFVTLKIAMSVDGKVAEKEGVQTKITGEKSQKQVHVMRKNHQAILVGSGTILTDNPHLGVRIVEGRDPVRILLTGEKEIPKNAAVFRDNNYKIFQNKSIEEVMKELYKEEIISVMVEGGPTVFTSFLKAQLADEIKIFIGPQMLGKNALNFAEIEDKISLSISSVQKLNPDVLITLSPQWDSNNG